MMAKKLGGNHLGDSGGGELSLDGLLSGMGDSVAENLVTEIGQLLDNAMKGVGPGGVKVIDLRNKGENKEDEETAQYAACNQAFWIVTISRGLTVNDDLQNIP